MRERGKEEGGPDAKGEADKLLAFSSAKPGVGTSVQCGPGGSGVEVEELGLKGQAGKSGAGRKARPGGAKK